MYVAYTRVVLPVASDYYQLSLPDVHLSMHLDSEQQVSEDVVKMPSELKKWGKMMFSLYQVSSLKT